MKQKATQVCLYKTEDRKWFRILHDTYTPQCRDAWAPHTQTHIHIHMHGVPVCGDDDTPLSPYKPRDSARSALLTAVQYVADDRALPCTPERYYTALRAEFLGL